MPAVDGEGLGLIVLQLLAVVLAVAVVVGLGAWLLPPVRRGLRLGWLHGRNLPFLLIGVRRWPVIAASSGVGRFRTVTRGDRSREVPVNAPGTRRWRTTPAGFEFEAVHRYGQSIETLRDAVPALGSGLRGQVRVLRIVRGNTVRLDRSRVVVNRRDPFCSVPRPEALSATRVRLGVVEDGRDWIADFRALPHWLVCGATGSGKSGLESAFLTGLAPTDAVVTLVDLKHGVSAAPYAPRASVVAESLDEAGLLFGDLLALGKARAGLVKAHGVDKVYDLPSAVRPREVYVVVDEVGELAVKDPENKEASAAAMRDLLRVVQLLRFAGIHVLVCGQRFGSAIHPQVTSIRAQLAGRCCLRADDAETAAMVVGDIATEATHAATSIPETTPGMAVVKGGPDGWQLARVSHVTHQALARAAEKYAEKATPWAVVMGEASDAETTATFPAIGHSDQAEPDTTGVGKERGDVEKKSRREQKPRREGVS